MAQIRIGISGWTYAPWRGTFFPKGLPQKRELGYAAEHVPTIEINGTFYSMQRPSSFASWYEQTPENFLFAIKGPRFITHMKKLLDCAEELLGMPAAQLQVGPGGIRDGNDPSKLLVSYRQLAAAAPSLAAPRCPTSAR